MNSATLEFYKSYGISTDPKYMGESPERGLLVVGKQYPNEGYATIRCGGTEVRIGYSLLHHLQIVLEGDSPVFSDLCDLSRALHSITCEASLGRKG
jgi:hypothetical protein